MSLQRPLTREQVANAFGVPPWLVAGERPKKWRRALWYLRHPKWWRAAPSRKMHAVAGAAIELGWKRGWKRGDAE